MSVYVGRIGNRIYLPGAKQVQICRLLVSRKRRESSNANTTRAHVCQKAPPMSKAEPFESPSNMRVVQIAVLQMVA